MAEFQLQRHQLKTNKSTLKTGINERLIANNTIKKLIALQPYKS